MLEELFRSSQLEMSDLPLAEVQTVPSWDLLLTNRIMVVVCVIALLVNIPSFIRLLPSLLDSITRVRANYELEHSVNLSRLRNISAALTATPICLLADRYELMHPQFLKLINPMWHIFIVMGILLAYLIFRRIMFIIPRPRRLSSEAADTVHHALYTYSIVMAAVMLATSGIMSALSCPDTSIKAVLTYEIIIIYFYSFVRTGQILGSHCSGLSTILYLCARELVPLSMLFIAAVVV